MKKLLEGSLVDLIIITTNQEGGSITKQTIAVLKTDITPAVQKVCLAVDAVVRTLEVLEIKLLLGQEGVVSIKTENALYLLWQHPQEIY